MAGPGCALGERVREERPAGRARGGGLAGAYQGRIVVVVGFGWAGPQLEPPTPQQVFADKRDVLVAMAAARGLKVHGSGGRPLPLAGDPGVGRR